jgi:glycosyltransferase involved in cell wall biosynthesis
VALSGYIPLVSMSWGYDLLVDAHRNALWRWATRFTLRCSAAMVGDCNTIRQLAVSFGMPGERIVTFPWGVDLQRFAYQILNLQPFYDPTGADRRATFNLLSTRGWEPIYGVDVIARAFVIAARQCPELRLIMLGNGSQSSQLRQIFMKAGLEDRVLFPGLVSQADLPRYYHLADLYLSASHSDGTSISLLEAMACGRPVLVSDIPGNREWVQDGANGWLFPDGDENALAQAIVNAVAVRDHLPEIGRAARDIAEQRADWERNFPELMRAYRIALPQW